ncbi:unnamed protein product [Closterium sp. NIES-54]
MTAVKIALRLHFGLSATRGEWNGVTGAICEWTFREVMACVASTFCLASTPFEAVLHSPQASLPFSHFSTLQSDTCWSISAQLGLTTNNLTALNPGLDCSEPIKAGRSLCVERNATFAFTVPQCLRYGVLTPQDTCERLLRQVAGGEGDPTGAAEVNAMRWAELYRNNPGLICSDVIPITASAVGSNTGVQVCGGEENGSGRRGSKR